MRKELIRKDWDYTLYETPEGLLLSVLAGTVALFEVEILLSQEEYAQYQLLGFSYLDRLANEVRSEPEKYQNRLP